MLPKVDTFGSTFETNIHALGSNVWQWDYAMLITIQMLYLVEFANWDVQTAIGYGSTSVTYCGRTDSIPYHTGCDNNACEYRYIEELWGNCNDWCSGIGFYQQKVYVVKNPADSLFNNANIVGTQLAARGYISALAKSNVDGADWVYFPSAASGADDKYIPDYYNYGGTYSRNYNLFVGGGYDSNTGDRGHGLFYMNADARSSSTRSSNLGSRLMVLPNTQS